MGNILSPKLKTRRIIASAFTITVIGVFYWIYRSEVERLGRPNEFTGFTLMACLGILVLLGVRRRLPFWPLGNVSVWTQVHLYVGLFSAAIYVMHVPALIAGGHFESFLSILFLMVTASGLYGIYASRTLPKKLTAVEGQHRFDRTGWGRQQIADAAEHTIGEVGESVAKEVLESFYHKSLSPFFGSRPSLAYVVVPTGGRRRQLLSDLKELDRYLENDGRKIAGQFAALVRHRDDLDYQFALQLRLRCWVVFHSLMSVILIVAALVHLCVVLRSTA